MANYTPAFPSSLDIIRPKFTFILNPDIVIQQLKQSFKEVWKWGRLNSSPRITSHGNKLGCLIQSFEIFKNHGNESMSKANWGKGLVGITKFLNNHVVIRTQLQGLVNFLDDLPPSLVLLTCSTAIRVSFFPCTFYLWVNFECDHIDWIFHACISTSSSQDWLPTNASPHCLDAISLCISTCSPKVLYVWPLYTRMLHSSMSPQQKGGS